MMKYCLKKWNKNKSTLEKAIREYSNLEDLGYEELLKLLIDNVLNVGEGHYKLASNKITVIDNGDYQGTLLFAIPFDFYQPSEGDYLMTYFGYGSCSGCDTLQYIRYTNTDKEQQIKDYMSLCRDMLCNMIKPYSFGWRGDESFEQVKVDKT